MGATGAGANGGLLACDKLPGLSDLGTANSLCLAMSPPRHALTQVSRPISCGTWGPMGVTGDWGLLGGASGLGTPSCAEQLFRMGMMGTMGTMGTAGLAPRLGP